MSSSPRTSRPSWPPWPSAGKARRTVSRVRHYLAQTLAVAERRNEVGRNVARIAPWHDTGLVFTSHIGTPLDPANLRRVFATLTESVGIGRWTLNELRHSAASLLSAGGVPLEVIADVLGHTSTRMLEQHYRHQLKPSIDAHVAVMEQTFSQAAGGLLQ